MFKKNDLVKLKDEIYNKRRTYLLPVNIFKISSIKDEKYTLILGSVESEFIRSEIEPILVNSNDNQYIKLDTVTLPTPYLPSQGKPELSESVDFDKLGFQSIELVNSNGLALSIKDIIKNNNIKYIHDLQKHLKQYCCDLCVKYY